MLCEVGTYTGNGTVDTAITGLAFQPDVVIVKRWDGSSDRTCVVTKDMPADATRRLATIEAMVANRIKSITSDGFTLGTDVNVNQNTSPYIWIALQAEASDPEFAVLTWTGDDVDGQTIACGFQPDVVICLGGDGVSMRTRYNTAQNGTDSCHRFDSVSPIADIIQSLVPTGFTVGGAFNTSSNEYYAIAFKDAGSEVGYAEYTGTGATLNVAHGLGTTPAAALWFMGIDASHSDSRVGIWHHDKSADEATLHSAAAATGRISAVDGTNVTVETGAMINQSSKLFSMLTLAEKLTGGGGGGGGGGSARRALLGVG